MPARNKHHFVLEYGLPDRPKAEVLMAVDYEWHQGYAQTETDPAEPAGVELGAIYLVDKNIDGKDIYVPNSELAGLMSNDMLEDLERLVNEEI